MTATKPDITLKIFRDKANAIYVRGFANVQQAIDAGNQWEGRLWWRVTIDGKIVTEEPMRAKR